MFFNGIAIFFYPYAIEGWWLNKIQEGNPILLLGHPLMFICKKVYCNGTE